MAKEDNQHFRLHRPSTPLPGESDFDPFGGDLDARCAWKNFGGLSLKQAYERFISAPEIYQEDFMFMGPVAFDYYFPIIDCYVREVSGSEDGDDCEVSILGSGVAAQFDWKAGRASDQLIREIADLSSYVLTHIDQYSPVAKDQRRIIREWKKVEAMLAER